VDQTSLSARLRAAVDRSPELEMPAEFGKSLTAQLRAQTASTETGPLPAVSSKRWLAIAAGLILVVGAGAAIQSALVGGRFSALARLAAGDHQNCAIKFALEEKPISLAEAATRYDPAFGRLEAVTPITTASAAPIAVLERHSCVYLGRPFAHIVLAYKDQVVSVLVADDGAVGSEWWRGATARELPSTGGYQMASFRTPSHIVFVVSALPMTDVTDVMRAVAAPVTDALTGV
jgi:hypothetical protein